MVTPSPTIMFSLIPFDIKPSRRAPQALNRIIEAYWSRCRVTKAKG